MYYNNLNRHREEDEDDDLKFIPLNIKEPFSEKDSNWFPIVNMNSPNINHMTNNFILGFSNSADGEMLDENFLKTIDYVPNVNYSYTDENYFNTYEAGNLSSNMPGNMSGNMQGNMPSNMTGNIPGNNYNQGFSQGGGFLPSNMLLSNSNISGMDNQSSTSFGNNFDLEYPSETQSEDLYSYNKEKNCNGATLGNGNMESGGITGNMNTGAIGMNNNMGNMNTGAIGMNNNMGNMNTGAAGMNNNMGNMNTGVTGMNNNMGNMNTGAAGMNNNMGNMNTGAAGMNNNMGNMNAGVAGMNNNMGNMNTGATGMNSNMWNMNSGITGMNSMWNMGDGFTGINATMENMNVGITGMDNIWNINTGTTGTNDNINNIFEEGYQSSLEQQYIPFSNFNLNPNNQFIGETNGNSNNTFTGDISGGNTTAFPNNMDINYNDSEPNYVSTNIQNMNPLNMGPNYTIPEGFNMNNTSSQTGTSTASNPKFDNSYNSFEKLNDYMKTYEKSGVIRSDKEIEDPPHMEILRELDLGSEYDSIYRDDKSKEIDSIFKKIEENHGAIISTLKAYRIPYPIISLLVKKIIKITLEHSNKE
ncbi:hypothetical protein PMY73_04780 [Clostridium tertium]|uniref:hypothetical protein n=1 Tax=Clostridium TaxID=1485 RepID=UPI001E05B9FB|nr:MULTISPECIES: hypothetical protein [Clostridium]MBS5305861.1 hypothetical protein [Clostridium sp.]MDB1944342.1 hypothetical protein [Clostridium tertium]MDB1950646.1 hypothetical protein [Clostridium tertium]